jgi:isopentenyl phosphate kinase
MLYFLKLGGSLITDKSRPHTARMDIIARLAQEIHSAQIKQPDLKLLIGHGSGSYGHVPASRYGTRQGVSSSAEWNGFVEVWREARALNDVILAAFAAEGLNLLAFPPSACALAEDAQVSCWELSPIQAALSAGIIPLVNGDTVFDSVRKGTILSTEDLFIYLAPRLQPQRILLAGIDEGVWADFPVCTHLLRTITPQDHSALKANIIGSAAVDVTGGMAEKVNLMLQMVDQIPGLQAAIFSGRVPGQLEAALTGDLPGTIIQGSNA